MKYIVSSSSNNIEILLIISPLQIAKQLISQILLKMLVVKERKKRRQSLNYYLVQICQEDNLIQCN